MVGGRVTDEIVFLSAIDEGQYVTVWKRQLDGSWKLSMDMGVPHP